jgi:hypothetical protein
MYIIFENNKLGLGGGGSDCHYVKRSFQATVLIINFLKHQPTRMISHGDPRLSVPRLLVAWLCQSNQRIISKQGNNVKGFYGRQVGRYLLLTVCAQAFSSRLTFCCLQEAFQCYLIDCALSAMHQSHFADSPQVGR